ncbi:hypothetical protein DFH09DRAFT_1388518 [Mycena vulgaris]|nr:hypothetical protein DFH09DRAFT_1388518 [Mycena vulgaris]
MEKPFTNHVLLYKGNDEMIETDLEPRRASELLNKQPVAARTRNPRIPQVVHTRGYPVIQVKDIQFNDEQSGSYMFRIPVPQRFGFVEPLLQASHLSITPEYSFDSTTTLLSFFQSAIPGRRAFSLRNNNEEHEKLCTRLDLLLKGLKALIALVQQTPYMSRFALTHSDLRPNNVILNETSGEVVGIVDWECLRGIRTGFALPSPSRRSIVTQRVPSRSLMSREKEG